MTATAAGVGSITAVAPQQEVREAVDRARISVLAGGVVGLIVGGVGGRLAMFLLRVTSPSFVRGIESDDGFTIGQFTLFGTLGFLALCTAIGIIGGFAYRAVAPALIGPPWLGGLTIALGSGAVVGSMLVHADGVDFTVLEPTWLAIALFVAIPAVFGAVIGPVIERWDQADAWVNRGGRVRWWLLPILVVVFVPIFVPFVLVGVAVMVLWAAIDGIPKVHSVRASAIVLNVLRVAWLAIAVLGLKALIDDITAIV